MWDKLKEQFNLLKLEKKKLYLITSSEKFISKDDFLDAIASALQGGVDIIQLREKSIPDNVIVEIGHKIRTLCDEFGATFIVNDRADIAKIVQADGVHLGYDDISVADAREVLGENAIIGKTTHHPDDIEKAIKDGADYITLGPISLNNKNQNAIDFSIVEWAQDNVKIPTFVTGDINLNNIVELTHNGINKIAVTDQIMYAKIPEQTARSFLRYLP
jgi:thiamine-phosphate pyrophosphorylase